MRKLLLLLFYLLAAWHVATAQLPTFRVDRVLNTPLDFPQDIEMSPARVLHVLDRTSLVQLDANGQYLREIPLRVNRAAAPEYSAVVPTAAYVYVVNRRLSFVRKYSITGDSLQQWGSPGTAPGQFAQPGGATTDGAGNIYVADTGNNRVQKLDANGQVQWVYSTGTTADTRPNDVKIDANGNVLVLCRGYQLVRLSPAGQPLNSFSLRFAGSVTYDETNTLALDAAGNLYVTSTRMDAVQRYNSQGIHLGGFGASSGVYGGLRPAQTFDAAGNLYVTDGTDRDPSHTSIRILSPAGTLVRRWGNEQLFGQRMRMDEAGNIYYTNYDFRQPRIIKLNAAGLQVATIGSPGTADGQFGTLSGVALDRFGNIYSLEGIGSPRIQKFDPRGRFLSKVPLPNPRTNPNGYQPCDLALDAAGNFYVLDYWGGVRKYDPQGQLLQTIGAHGGGSGSIPGHFYAPRGLVVDYRGNIYVSDGAGHRVQKFSPSGQLVREYLSRFGPTFQGSPSLSWFDAGLAVDGIGNIFASVGKNDYVTMFEAGTNRQVKLPVQANLICVNQSGTRLLTAMMGNDVLRYYVPTTQPLSSQITGKVFQDLNNDCQQQAAEPGLANLVVVAEPGPYYALTDENGFYALPVDTGRYTVRQWLAAPEPGRDVQQLCVSTNGSVMLPTHGNSVSGPDFGNAVSLSPVLTVHVSANRRRRCFRNVTTVSYANTGYAPAVGAVVAVALPPQVAFLSATMPHSVDSQGRYLFQVGTLQPLERGSITIQDSVVCGDPSIRGLTVCTRAWITPLASRPAPPGWNRASLAVRGRVMPGNQVRFVVRNEGSGPTTDSLGLRVYQDTRLALTHRIILTAGDSLVLRWPAIGPVVRVETDQPAQHPIGRPASATVEVPGLRTPGQVSPAAAAMPPGHPEPEAAEDCQPVLDSYDPNDKLVLPVGVTAQHYIPTNTPLQYRVRFQNTGNDVAYRVEVVDTLAAELDLSTLQVEAASHPYRLTVTGQRRPVLTFTFANIMLPDSASDPVRSNGFVQFSVRPLTTLAPRTRVDNFADIFFDYNPAVRTNTTTNRIYDVPLVVEPAVALTYSTMLASPTITAFTPVQGRFGTVVALTGQRFAPVAANNQVRFNGVLATVLSASATSLTVRVPAGSTTGSVTVATADGGARSANFVVFQPPTLTAVSPSEGQPGSVVTITGANFSLLATEDTVTFNGVPARVLQASTNSLQVEVPAGATLGRIRLRTLGGQVESAQPFMVWYPPTISDLTPGRGRVGATVTLRGSNFAEAALRNVVTFGGGQTAPVVQTTAGQLIVKVPTAAQSGPIQLQTPGGQVSTAANFVVVPAPVITGFTPLVGPVGTAVTLIGSNFNAEGLNDTIGFNGVTAKVLRATANSVEVLVPRDASSGSITVAGAGGKGTSGEAFVVTPLPLKETVTVHPNPTRGSLTIGWQHADFVIQQVHIYDALGSLIIAQQTALATSDELSINLAHCRAGLYLVMIDTPKGRVVKRITLL